MYIVAIKMLHIGSLTKSVFKVNIKDISNNAKSMKPFNNSDIYNLLSQYKLTYREISGAKRNTSRAERSEARRF